MRHLYNYQLSYLYTAAILFIFLLSACNNGSRPADEDLHSTEEALHEADPSLVELTQDQYEYANIQLAKLQNSALSNRLKVNGEMAVRPQNKVSISAPRGGFVASCDLTPGMRVKKGQLLAVMEHPDFVQLQQDYLDKKVQLEYLSQEYKRQEVLSKEHVSAVRVFQQAESDFLSMKVQLKGLEEQLSMIGVDPKGLNEANLSGQVPMYAPISGDLSLVNVNQGKYANPTDVLFEIVDATNMYAVFMVYEQDVKQLKMGQLLTFETPGNPAKLYEAQVQYVEKHINADHAVRVYTEVKGSMDDLIPGMYVQGWVELERAKLPALPNEAVVRMSGKNYVYIAWGSVEEHGVDMHQFEMREVKVLLSEQGYSALQFLVPLESDSLDFVVRGAFSLLSKMNNQEEGGHAH